MCGIELVCQKHVFAEFFQQAGVKASLFDVIANFKWNPEHLSEELVSFASKCISVNDVVYLLL